MDFPPFPPCFPRGFPAENLLFHVSFWSFPRKVLKSAWKVLKTARFFHEKEEFSAARRQRKEKLSHRGESCRPAAMPGTGPEEVRCQRSRSRPPPSCRRTAHSPWWRGGRHPRAGFYHVLHNGLLIAAIGKFHLHLLGHEADSRLFHTGNGVGSVLHLLGAVCTVHFDLVGLFHRRYQPFCFCAGRSPENHSSIWSIPRERMLRTWSSSSA